MDKKYTCWTWHGEDDPNEVVCDDDDTKDDIMLLNLSNIVVSENYWMIYIRMFVQIYA